VTLSLSADADDEQEGLWAAFEVVIMTTCQRTSWAPRELKTRLGTYLRRVQRGQRLIVTDRGRPVAELCPITAEVGVDAVLTELEAQGVAVRPSRTGLPPFRPIGARGTSLSAAVVSDRDDRF
jgi:prevent-host-death family protein